MTSRSKFRNLIGKANSFCMGWGFDARKMVSKIRGIGPLYKERRFYEQQRLSSDEPNQFPITKIFPFYEDRYETAGEASGHYFHQDLYVAREIFNRKPERHVDVGSSIYGFVSHVATFRTIEVLDIRPMRSSVKGVTFIQQDIMEIDENMLGYTDSISCLHALEHFGLGRYGDPIDYSGWAKGLSNLTSMLEPGGMLYLSVPTGSTQRVEFNAHRVFSLPFLRGKLEEDYSIEGLAFVTDSGDLAVDLDPHSDEANSSFSATYGCSIWVLKRSAE